MSVCLSVCFQRRISLTAESIGIFKFSLKSKTRKISLIKPFGAKPLEARGEAASKIRKYLNLNNFMEISIINSNFETGSLNQN